MALGEGDAELVMAALDELLADAARGVGGGDARTGGSAEDRNALRPAAAIALR